MNNRSTIKLGVNIDHVATIRQARFTAYPDLIAIVKEVESAGADGITLHLREDRRHIQDADVAALRKTITSKMNLEMAATSAMIDIAIKTSPEDCCLVPEKREELTTEGGLDVIGQQTHLKKTCKALAQAGIEVSIFIEPGIDQISAAAEVGAPVIELHTGTYANAGDNGSKELENLFVAAEHAHQLGLVVNAGHGLDYRNLGPVLEIPYLNELNIGHSIVSRAMFVGMHAAVKELKCLLSA